MKKVLYVTTVSRTINAFLIPHINMLLDNGYEVHCACSIDKPVDKELQRRGVKIFEVPFSRNPLGIRNIKAFKKLEELQRINDYDIVHVHTPIAAIYGRLLKLNFPSLRIIYTAHGYHFLKGGSKLGWIIYYPIEKIMAKFTDVTININKEDYEMYSMDFEEFLWAKGYKEEQIEELYNNMKTLKPFSDIELKVMFDNFREYMIIGGMPAIVNLFVNNDNYSGTLKMQKQILQDYEEDITKYAGGLDHAKILNVYRKIPVFLGNENKKFQISKIENGARKREYVGTVDWLNDAGIINVCYCMEQPELPLGGNYNPDNYRIYFRDTGLLIGSLDEEAQEDLRDNKNFNTYKGAIYENIIGDMLVKQGYKLYFYKNSKGTIEMDFFIRDKNSLIPVEVKANDGATISLNNLIDSTKFKDIKYGIKLGYKNIGFNGKFYTFPYFLTFLLKRYLREK